MSRGNHRAVNTKRRATFWVPDHVQGHWFPAHETALAQKRYTIIISICQMRKEKHKGDN